MRKEVIDPHSGAILFKRDEDGVALEELQKEFKKLKDYCIKLEKRVKELEKSSKE